MYVCERERGNAEGEGGREGRREGGRKRIKDEGQQGGC